MAILRILLVWLVIQSNPTSQRVTTAAATPVLTLQNRSVRYTACIGNYWRVMRRRVIHRRVIHRGVIQPLGLVFLVGLLLACQSVAELPELDPMPFVNPQSTSALPTPSQALPASKITPTLRLTVEGFPSQTATPATSATLSPTPSDRQGVNLDALPGINFADVTEVSVSGTAGSYQFSVTVHSPDTGCDQYSDWWELIDLDGSLIYRRVLSHSHVGEQPFTRSGGPVKVEAQQTVLVRAHMSTGGYGGSAFSGSVAQGFQAARPEPSFAAHVELQPPLPSSCAF